MIKTNILTIALVMLISSMAAQKISAPKPVYPIPSKQQLQWHEMEMYAFIHFTTNTFTDKEWGYGDESPTIFNPTSLDANQWAKTLKDAGFKAIILTTKHHDGFALWPSKYTNHSVKNSPYKNGKGDIVKETSDAAKKYGLKFGVYLSPWDRNHADYGTEKYITYYRNQLKELFTHYGSIFEMWFDGAMGGDGYYGGKRTTVKIDGSKYYNWPTTLKLVRSIQPQVLFFSDAGPDIRWVGNEKGIAGTTNWNTITPDTLYAGKAGINDILSSGAEDGKKWIPAEVDVSIRPGWFYHAKEDAKVKTPEQLFDIYLSSVGRGSNLLLNIPPDRRGLFHENDVAALLGFKKLLAARLSKNLAAGAKVKTSNTRGNNKTYRAGCITDGNKETYWTTDDNIITPSIEINIEKENLINYILLQEYIALGQRVKSFAIDVWKNNQWKEVAAATTIGYKRIVKIDPVTSSKIRVRILDAKASPLISNIAVY